jgi:4-hydroxybenzoate polyprenyltransferase
MDSVVKSIEPFLRVLRFKLHQNFAIVIFGSIFFGGNAYDQYDSNIDVVCHRVADLLCTYFSFNICLYGAIYTINEIADAEEDRNHPVKRFRSVPSGDLSQSTAIIYTVTLIITAFASSYLFFGSTKFFGIFGVFIALNVSYTFIFKGIKYSRFFTAGLTSPTRLALGAMVAEAETVPIPCFMMAYFFMVNAQNGKVRAEKGQIKSSANGFSPGVIEAICIIGSIIAMILHYPNNAPFLIAVFLANMVYTVIPMISAPFSAYLLGADMEQASKKA